jgi:outer membrane protein OmpA-like peptidoglycan-associated protein
MTARFLATAALAAVAALTNGCATGDAQPAEPARPLPLVIQPQHTGMGQRFVQCTVDCEQPTSKTPAAAVVAQVRARPATVDTASPVSPVAEAQPSPEPVRATVTFGFASAELTAQAKERIRELLPQLQRAHEVRITGFTDNLGKQSPNTKLADARALRVMQEVRRLLPDAPMQLRARGQALCCYVADNGSDGGRESNRRAEIEIAFADPKERS